MIYGIGFYWLCAGIASFKLDRFEGDNGLVALVFAVLLGGVAIPVKILEKLAGNRPTHVINHHVDMTSPMGR